ncbi:MAG: family 20 glycosylhydrolase [Fimbriimonadaceae bacterium]
MRLRMWMYDLAREQSPTLNHLRLLLDMTREAGYNAFGLYMEHRFAYPSTPWAHGKGCVTPDTVRTLIREYPEVQIIPFVNLLGHFEGMLYTEDGKQYRESLMQGMQACPSKPEFVSLCERLIDDVADIFSSEIIHIGGDETWQLGACARCEDKVEDVGKAELYGSHFGPLARRVIEKGRRPAVWGDMFLDHPEALEHMPRETLIFDWHYFKGPLETAKAFMGKGFEVVCCPTIQNYNAMWMHLPQSEENVRQHAQVAADLGAYGVCVTTWEMGLFGSYETLLPAIRACGDLLPLSPMNGGERGSGGEGAFLKSYLRESERYEEWARLMGVELQSAGGVFALDGHRNRLKSRLLLYSNPFLAWMHHAEELCGEVGDKALDVIERALAVAPNEATKGISLAARSAIEFVRLAEAARKEYAAGKPESAIGKLSPARQLFDDLANVARRTHERIGGSLADIERCKAAKEHVERVISRIRQYGDGILGYLPAFEMIAHPKFVPHDQAAWWLINRWGNE